MGRFCQSGAEEFEPLSPIEAPKVSGSAPVRMGASGKVRKLVRPKTGCSPECREGAVKPLIETSRPIARVAKELVINAGTLSNWVKAYPCKHAEKELPLTIDERSWLKELECEIRGSVWKSGFPKEMLNQRFEFLAPA